MSTTGITTWAVDLADVGPVYPLQGSETILVIVGVVCWLGWHVWCTLWEQAYKREKIRKYGSADMMRKGIDQG